ncbi:hypothetical protein BamMEX5DRAFT_5600 [Burkholderia ambifaria MEX-5]|uniref:Uncharacterized protein n=1 Tax=Burkholderia ambifaria MEX-5 TaxID=396597 RepID=B1TCT4_9BURK|nr:hypothetical protein BamMEX5DRAFT_5600 [Burkholderia ambifaria MEX-5]
MQVDRDARMLGQERVDDRHDARLPEVGRRAEPHGPRQRLRAEPHAAFEFVRFGKQPPRAGDQRAALVGEADRAGRAREQRRAVMALERRQPLGDRGRRQADLAAGRGQPALFHDAQEQREVIEQHSSLSPNYIFEVCPIIRLNRKR